MAEQIDARPHVRPPSHEEPRIIARLARRREWIIPDRTWQEAPEMLQRVIDDDNADTREKIQAARTLVMMSNSVVAAQSVEVRINQAIAVNVEAPPSSEDTVLPSAPAFIEQVNTASMSATVDVLESLGLMGRYVEQVAKRESLPGDVAPTSDDTDAE